ncbi:MAG: hypothetical protein JRJ87_05695 [Deltaproteobacteria bacterium]|nr:hypothetical protein [Deltaproteobacteria bacterium]
MTTATIAQPNIDTILGTLASDLRQFVAKLQRPNFADHRWTRAAYQRCQELSDRFGALKESLAAHKKTLPKSIAELRNTLQNYASELKGKCTRARLSEMRGTLACKYEDFVASVRSLKLFGSRAKFNLRSLRLPKLGRSVFHAGMGLTAVLMYQLVLSQRGALIILLTLASTFTLLEITRRFSKRFNDFLVFKVFGGISRPRERYHVNSATYYLFALVLITLVAPKPAVCMACLVLGFGDPIASLVGSSWGKYRLKNNKSLIGSLSFLAVSLIATYIFLLFAAPQISIGLRLAIVSSVSLAGTLVELFSDSLDDNFTVPVMCALVGALWF